MTVESSSPLVEVDIHPSWQRALTYVPRLLIDLVSDPQTGDDWLRPIDGTMLFADVSGFTPLSERFGAMGPEGAERLRKIINDYLGRMLAIAGDLGGDNLKFGGDAILLAFVGDDHGARAVRAAVEMQQATTDFPTVRQGSFRQRLGMSIGIHTGVAWYAGAGIPGTRMQHLLFGTDVATLAATEAVADEGQVVITAETRDRLGGRVGVTPITDVTGATDRFVVTRAPDAARAPLGLPTATYLPNLLPYLPPPVATAASARAPDVRGTGEHRRVTVVFVGIRGINELTDTEGATVAHAALRDYVKTALDLLERHQGYLAENDVDPSGAKLFCLFGAPVAHEDDAGAALRFAADLLAAHARSASPLRHMIGVNAGAVFAGDIGSERRRDYTIIGDAVNVSARLMGKAAPGTAVASRRVVEMARMTDLLVDVEAVELKGKSVPVDVVRLHPGVSLSTTHEPARTARLVGREREAATVGTVLDEVLADTARTVVVTGGPGAGCSSLVSHALAPRPFRRLEGRCYPYTVYDPFTPIRSVLEQLFDLRETPEEQRRAVVRERVATWAPDRSDDADLLGEILGIDLEPDSPWRATDPESRRRILMSLISRVLRGAAAEMPLAVVVEDVQWVDASSRQLLDHLTADATPGRVALVLTRRPEPPTPPFDPDHVSEVVLGNLDHPAVDRLVASLLDTTVLPRELLDVVWNKTGGNPLFVVQLVSRLREELAAVLDSPAALVAALDGLELPDRVQGLLMGRLDRLGQTAKHVVTAAAVLGASFDLTTLREVLDDVGELDEVVGRVAEAGVVRPIEPPGTYEFDQALVQDVAYESLAFTRRRDFHRRAAESIERRFAPRLEPHFADLARHYRHGGDPARTVRYAVAAGDRARRLYAHAEAILNYQHALAALDELRDAVGPARSHVRERIADSLELAGQHAEAADEYRGALRGWRASRGTGAFLDEVSRGHDLALRHADLARKIATSLERGGVDFDGALRWLDRSEAALPRRGDPWLRASIEITRASALLRKGRYEEAIVAGRRGLARARRVGDEILLARAHDMLASPYIELGRLHLAMRHRLEAIAGYERTGYLPGLLIANNNLAVAYQNLGRLDDAVTHYEASIRAGERIGRTSAVATVHNNLGEVELLRGRPAEAIEHFALAVRAFKGTGTVAGLALVNLARAHRQLGDLDAAADELDTGLELLRETGAQGWVVDARVERAELFCERGDPATALLEADAALAEARRLGMTLVEAGALLARGRARAAAGLDGARDDITESIALATASGAAAQEAAGRAALAELTAGSVRQSGVMR